MAKPRQKSRQELEDTILRKALTDDKFRAALLADPKAMVLQTLSQEFPDAKLPDGFSVKAIEEPANTLTLVIPSVQELSEAQLEQVAGGIKITIIVS